MGAFDRTINYSVDVATEVLASSDSVAREEWICAAILVIPSGNELAKTNAMNAIAYLQAQGDINSNAKEEKRDILRGVCYVHETFAETPWRVSTGLVHP